MLHAILVRLSRSVFHPRALERGVPRGVSEPTLESRMLLSLMTLLLNLLSELTVSRQMDG